MRSSVTIIIPCFNAAAFIERCLSSVIGQCDVHPVIICVDDGSTDNTADLIRRFSDKNNFPVQLLLQNNQGACAARNAGLAVATTEYVQFLDADDELLDHKLNHQLQLVKQYAHPDFIAAPYSRQYSNGRTEYIPVETDAWIGLIRGRLGCTCSNLFRRESVLTAGGWNSTLKSSQEAELMFRMLKLQMRCVTGAENDTRINVRESESVSTRNRGENLERYYHLREDILVFLRESGLMTPIRERNLSAIMLGTLRMIYASNPELALRMHAEFKKNRLDIAPIPPITKLYSFIYKLFGFRTAQRLALLLK